MGKQWGTGCSILKDVDERENDGRDNSEAVPAVQIELHSFLSPRRTRPNRKGESRGANAWSVSPDADFIIPDDRPMYDLALRPRPHRCQVMISG